MADKSMTTFYEYSGDGAGIPGVPHRLTRGQASELSILAELDAAIAAGVYVAEKATKTEEAENGR